MTIVPRWEWRTFGDHFPDAERCFTELEPERVEESDDTYVLSAQGDASVKVRGGLLDVKALQRTEGGLELWKPVAKLSFPLTQPDVRATLDALEAADPQRGREANTLDELVAERPDLRVVNVRKRRIHYTLGGCMVELSDIVTDDGATRTIGVESEHADRVLPVVRELALLGRPNVSLPRKLKALCGLGARRYAVIDVGTNSVKFHVAERRADGEFHRLADRAEVTRLGEDLDASGRLGDEPIRRTVAAIAAMADEAHVYDAVAVAAVGTAGLRIAPNRSQLLDAVRARSGVDIEVISGEEEARLAYRAATAGLDTAGSLAVFDTGGGSSQFTFGHGGGVDERFSVNVGAARFTEQFGLDVAVDAHTLAAAAAQIASELARVHRRPAPDLVVGMGGAVTNLAAVKHGLATYDADVIHGTTLDRAEIDRQVELYRDRDAERRRAVVGLQPARAPVILAGALIVRAILGELGRESLTVSDRGLRHGLLLERFSER